MKSFDELTTIATNQSKMFCGFWHKFTIQMKQKEHTKSRTNNFHDYNSSILTNEQTNNNILLLLWLIQKIIHILETVQFSLWSIVYQCDETVSLLLNLEASVCAYRLSHYSSDLIRWTSLKAKELHQIIQNFMFVSYFLCFVLFKFSKKKIK